eukprot:5592772-Prymnesium_polylepis.1
MPFPVPENRAIGVSDKSMLARSRCNMCPSCPGHGGAQELVRDISCKAEPCFAPPGRFLGAGNAIPCARESCDWRE